MDTKKCYVALSEIQFCLPAEEYETLPPSPLPRVSPQQPTALRDATRNSPRQLYIHYMSAPVPETEALMSPAAAAQKTLEEKKADLAARKKALYGFSIHLLEL